MVIRQLTGSDANFLHMETSRSFGHVSSMSVYSRPDDPDFSPFEAFRAQLEQRLHLIEPFRRRLVEVPLGLDRPYWINDPDFDLDFHVRSMGLPRPGSLGQLTDQVARIIGRPLDRTRPLWEVYVIEGLEGDDFAILTKIHHATIDGAQGVELHTIMLDDTADSAPATATGVWKPDAVPTPYELLQRATVNFARSPLTLTRISMRAMSDLAKVANRSDIAANIDAMRRQLPRRRSSTVERDRPPSLPLTAAPPTPFNKTITAHRRFAIGSVPLERVKTIKNVLGVTINDVVMSVCAAALRRYLQAHDALPKAPLVALVPVSIRTGEEDDKWTNRLSAMVATLPTDIDDPIERVRAMNRTMQEAKSRFDMMPAELIIEINQLMMPALATRATRLATATRITDRLSPPVNLVISNVPGPRQTLYCAGAPLKHFYPVSTVVDGQGLNMTVQSYRDTLDFGLVACRELVPDLWDLLDFCLAEVELLHDLCIADAPAALAAEPIAHLPKRRAPKRTVPA
jgi:diacylglycerol O-acyltransferase / wax synthase